MISIKVPSRICFFGDHQDYLGLPVIAGTINRFIELNARPIKSKRYEIELLDLKESRTVAIDDPLEQVEAQDYFRSGMAVLKKKGFDFQQGYQVSISGNIPLNAGLSSSSALIVAWIRFLVAQQQTNEVTNEEIGQFAYEAEVKFFNQPGGLMDQYTIAQGGLLYIDTQTGRTEQLVGRLGSLVIAESGLKKQTLDVLSNGRLFQERAIAEVKKAHPAFDIQHAVLEDFDRYANKVSKLYNDHWYAAIHNYEITKNAYRLLSTIDDNCVELGRLMNAHQDILENRIQNTPEQMVNMVKAAVSAGAFGAKIIGSGGGGCMVALVNKESKQRVIDAFLDQGAKAAYEVELTSLNT